MQISLSHTHTRIYTACFSRNTPHCGRKFLRLNYTHKSKPAYAWKWTVKEIMVKFSRHRPGVAQSLGRGIALLFHDRGTTRGWVVSSTPWPHFTSGINVVPILQEAGWAPGPVWTGGKSRPHRDSIPDRPARSQSLYRLSYRTIQHIEPNYTKKQL